MIFDTAPTPLDVNFRLFGIPVRVTPWFWVVMGLLGSPTLNSPAGALALAVWIACGFVSILVHELGHALSARLFNRPSRIVLIAFGGYAEYYDGAAPSGWRRLLTILAGPGAGFLLLGLLVLSELSTSWADQHIVLRLAFTFLFIQNLVWSLFNLLPIFPMDGGQALREVLHIAGHRRPAVPTHLVSVVVAGSLVLVGVTKYVNPGSPLLEWLPYIPGPFMMIWMGMLAYQNWQLYQANARVRSWDDEDADDDRPWLRR